MRLTVEMAPDDRDDTGIRMVDWKTSPSGVFEIVDDLLEAHGLEIVEHRTDADHHDFHIEPRLTGDARAAWDKEEAARVKALKAEEAKRRDEAERRQYQRLHEKFSERG